MENKTAILPSPHHYRTPPGQGHHLDTNQVPTSNQNVIQKAGAAELAAALWGIKLSGIALTGSKTCFFRIPRVQRTLLLLPQKLHDLPWAESTIFRSSRNGTNPTSHGFWQDNSILWSTLLQVVLEIAVLDASKPWQGLQGIFTPMRLPPR